MKGDISRVGRATGGALKKQACKNVVAEAKGAHPKNTPDAATSRGEGPIFRADGGVVEREDGGRVERKKGGRIAKQLGGAIGGGGKKPSMGRAGRARGGGVGADLHPQTHHGGSGPKGRHLMSNSEREPPRNES